MATGTVYTDKDLLLEAMERIKYNTSFQSSSEKIQQSMKDIIESLWDKGVVINELAAYSDLTTAISNSTLAPGQFYTVPYKCVHLIPGTTVLNTSSAQYSELIETFLFKATSVNTIDPWVTSLQFPKDKIMWDVTNNLAEDSITARSGKIEYREDPDKRLIAYYDWRSVLFRRGRIDTSTYTSWTPGQNWTRGDLANFSGGIICQATMNMTNDIIGNTNYQRWTPINNPASPSSEWVWVNNAPLLNTTIPRTNTVDKLSFINCQDISLGKTVQNFGYNNIVFDYCSNIKLTGSPSNSTSSYDCHFQNVHSIVSSEAIINSSLVNVYDCEIDYMSACTVNLTDDCDFKDIATSALYFVRDSVVGAGAVDNVLSTLNKVTIGPECKTSTLHYLDECSIGSSCDTNTLVNIVNTSFGNSVTNNKLAGFTQCRISNYVRDCDFETAASNYNNYTNVTIESDCYNLAIINTGINPNGVYVDDVTFKQGCHDIIIDNTNSGIYIRQTTFGENCYNFSMTGSGSNILNTVFGPSCYDFVISGANATVNNSNFGPGCNTFTLSGINSVISRSRFGANCTTFLLSVSSAEINSSSFGNNVTTVTVGASSNINYCNIGDKCSTILVGATGGGCSLTYSSVGEGVSTISIINGSKIENTSIGNKSNIILLENSSQLVATEIGHETSTISLTNSAIVKACEIGPFCAGKSFDNAAGGGNIIGLKIIEGDNLIETYDVTNNLAKTRKPLSVAVTAGAASLNLQTTAFERFYLSHSAATVLTVSNMPGNKEFYFIFYNSTGGAFNFTVSSTHGVADSIVQNIPAGETHVLKIRRELFGSIDELTLLETTVL